MTHTHTGIDPMMRQRLPEQPATGCPDCGSREVFAAVARPGERERAVYLRCRDCGRERADLEFYEA